MRNLTAWLAGMAGRVRKTHSASRTSGLSSRRYAAKLGHFVPRFSTSSVSLLGGARPRAVFGTAATLFDRRLCIQRDVHPEGHGARSQLLRNPPQRGEISGLVRTHFNLRVISFGANMLRPAAPHDSFTFNPERFLGDTLTCAESSNLPNAMDRDHWAFGAGYVQHSLALHAGVYVRVFNFLFRIAPAAAAFVRASTSQNGSCGSRSRGCSGRTTSARYPRSPYPWTDTPARLRASRSRIASRLRLDMIGCRRCLRGKRKSC